MLMVLLDLDATAIYEAPRALVLKTLSGPRSRAWKERGALSVSKFKVIGKLRGHQQRR
ncbi:MAG: hypothetical protein ABSF85_05610 [Terriglobales bacterium]